MEKELDNNVLKLLACVKYKHKNINNTISDPEIYCLLEALLKDDNCQQVVVSTVLIPYYQTQQ